MSKALLESSDSSDGEDNGPELKINESFAKVFNNYREKEEYQKLKDKYGDKVDDVKDDDSASSSSSEEEDEDGEDWTEALEKDFFTTLANLKRKDARIYDGKTNFFGDKVVGVSKAKKSADDDKPLTIGDLERKVMLEKGGEFDDMEDERLRDKKTYVEEMDELRKSFKGEEVVDSDDDGDILVKKAKTKGEKAKEDEDYRLWLAGQKDSAGDEEMEKELESLKEFWSDKNLDEGEAFLRDYILNKRHLEADGEEECEEDGEDFSEDEKTLAEQEEFETKYNFRYEEPDQEFIKRYPRTIKDSMRQKNETRKKKRDEVKERKAHEKQKKREELKQLKALKRKEIMGKLDQLRKITGNEELAFNDDDLEEDFDPEKYDERMKAVFDEYDDAPLNPDDEVKPDFSDMDEDSDMDVENWDEWTGRNTNENDDGGQDDDEDVGDVEVAGVGVVDNKAALQKELIESTRRSGRKKSKKKRSAFAESVESDKPVFDPAIDKKTFDEYVDEYYKLDYEDIIGDLPCRFKYRKVTPNDLGLSTEEILSAPDRELNAWCSLKKTCQYRSEEDEIRDVDEYKKKAGNLSLKKKLLPTLFDADAESALADEKEKRAGRGKKSRRRRKRLRDAGAESSDERLRDARAEGSEGPPPAKKQQHSAEGETRSMKKRRRRKARVGKDVDTSVLAGLTKNNNVNKELGLSDARLENYGLKPNQFKRQVRKRKYKAAAQNAS